MSLGLLVLRITLGTYLLQWAWLNFQYPTEAIKIYSRWYNVPTANLPTNIIGITFGVLGTLMVLGIGRRFSYGAAAIAMSIMVGGLLPHLINPFGVHKAPYYMNHALVAQVPMIAGYLALFFLYPFDRYSLDQLLRNNYRNQSQPLDTKLPNDFKVSLILMFTRISCALFFLFWGSEKFVKSEMSVGIFERWYGVSSNQYVIATLVGVIEIVLAFLIALGLFRGVSYGIALIIKTKTIWAISALIFFPFASQTGGRLSTVGASPSVFSVLLFLFLVRHWDNMSLLSERPKLK